MVSELLEGNMIRRYQALVGALQHLAMVTRYDTARFVTQLSRACSKPSKPHMAAAKRVLRYLKGCPDLGIDYKKGNPHIEGYVDVSFVANLDTRRSIMGYLFMIEEGPGGFRYVMQTLTAQWTVETELIALSYGTQKVVYLLNLLSKLSFKG